jgi:uncharacterized protein YegL
MTDPGYVHYIMVIDRSGSMQPLKADTEGGIRSFVDKQLEGVDGDKRTVSFYQFDTTVQRVHDFAKLEAARDYRFTAGGMTALLDAVGTAITEVGAQLRAMPEERRPGYVMALIITDGHENASREYKKSQIKEMIEHQQDKYGWRFTYLGANQDAFAEADSIGIAAPSTLSWTGTSRSLNTTYDILSTSVSLGTVSTSTGIYYTNTQREAASGV